MRRTITATAAFLALAGLTGVTAASAEGRGDLRGQHGGRNLAQADADSSGDITFEEFAAAMNGRFQGADADGDGKMTVAEIADAIERQRMERRARRLIERYDADGDGALTMAEVEARQKKRFALLDRDDDGKIAEDEMPRRGRDRRHR